MFDKQESIDRIYKIAEMTHELTDEDFAAVDEMIIDQKNTISPLRMKEAAEARSYGEHNERIVAKLRELKNTIEDYEE